jgi:heavy-metal-associated domain-containing protein
MHAAPVYIHALEGRFRIKVPELRGASDVARDIESRLRALPAVDEATANPVTGNVLVLYDPRRITHAQIVDLLQSWGCLAGVAPNAMTRGNRWMPRRFHVDIFDAVARSTMEFALQQLFVALI